MSKSLKKIASFALPIIGTLVAPGIGTALGSTLSGAGLAAIGGGLGGAAGGAIGGGGLKGALKGALLGGGGGYLSAGGGIPGLGSFGGKLGAGGMGPPTPGSGILGSISKGTSGLTKALGGAGSGGGLSLGNVGTALSGIHSYGTQDDAEEMLLKAQGKASEAFSPYQQSGLQANQMLSDKLASGELGGTFSPGDLTQDPGYQFKLAQGQKGLMAALAAQGMSQSGAAVKASTEYNQGLADQTYNDAYNKWLQSQQNTYNMLSGQSGQGFQAAGSMADIYGNQGNIGANAATAKSNILTGTLSSILSGAGQKQILYIDANGDPVYA